MLEPQQEFMLAKRWREHGDRDAAHKLVTSHLRLVAKIAMGYRGYGLPIAEVISEGNVGLMQAVKRFEPDKGFRLATYAMWWIKAAIQEYILRSWSLVKMGTTANQKKLFFNLRKAKGKISALEEGDLRPDQVKLIAKRLGVDGAGRGRHEPPSRRRHVAQRADPQRRRSRRMAGLAGRRSRKPGNGAGGTKKLDNRRQALPEALSVLNERERRIFEARRLAEEPVTLEDLAAEFGVSRERVRQIEVRAFEKVQKAVKSGIAALEQPVGVPRCCRALSSSPAPNRRRIGFVENDRREIDGVFYCPHAANASANADRRGRLFRPQGSRGARCRRRSRCRTTTAPSAAADCAGRRIGGDDSPTRK